MSGSGTSHFNMITMPKSGSGFWNLNFGQALNISDNSGRKNNNCMAVGNTPEELVAWSMVNPQVEGELKDFVNSTKRSGTIFYLQSHMQADLWGAINASIGKCVVHIRDPRQALLSWAKQHRALKDQRITYGIEGDIIPQSILDGTWEDQIKYYIENEYPKFVNWLVNWLRVASENAGKILLTTFDDLFNDNMALVAKILNFMGYTNAKDVAIESRASDNGHFRCGELYEFARVYSSEQMHAVNALIPEEIFVRFGWEKYPDTHKIILPSIMYPVRECSILNLHEVFYSEIPRFYDNDLSTSIKEKLQEIIAELPRVKELIYKTLAENSGYNARRKIYAMPATNGPDWMHHIVGLYLPIPKDIAEILQSVFARLNDRNLNVTYQPSDPRVSNSLSFTLLVVSPNDNSVRGKLIIKDNSETDNLINLVNTALHLMNGIHDYQEVCSKLFKYVVKLKCYVSWVSANKSITEVPVLDSDISEYSAIRNRLTI